MAHEQVWLLGETLKNIQKDFENVIPRVPIIAGGAIRDIYFPKQDRTKDYDVFLHIPDKTSEEIDDIVYEYGLTIIDNICKKLSIKSTDYFVVKKEFSQYIDNTMPMPATRITDAQFQTNTFSVYDLTPRDTFDHLVLSFPIQLVVRNEKILLEKDCLSFLDTFDYSLVKCMFDPLDMQYKISEELKTVLETKELIIDFSKFPNDTAIWITYRRALGALRNFAAWSLKNTNDRTFDESINRTIASPDIKLVVKREGFADQTYDLRVQEDYNAAYKVLKML